MKIAEQEIQELTIEAATLIMRLASRLGIASDGTFPSINPQDYDHALLVMPDTALPNHAPLVILARKAFVTGIALDSSRMRVEPLDRFIHRAAKSWLALQHPNPDQPVLTLAEARLLVSASEGNMEVNHEEGQDLVWIVSAVSEADEDEKPSGIACRELVARLEAMSDAERLLLWDAVECYWDCNGIEGLPQGEEALLRLFHIESERDWNDLSVSPKAS